MLLVFGFYWIGIVWIYSFILFHLIGIRIGTDSFSSHSGYDIDVSSIVLQTFLGPSSRLFLLIFLFFDFGGLTLYLTGTCQRSMYFAHDILVDVLFLSG